MRRKLLNCPGPANRRTFMQIGGLSLGALAGGLASPNLAHLLAAQDQTEGADNDFNVILLWANGGPSHLDTFDLKPEAAAEYRGPFRPIDTIVPGMQITELLPNLAKMGDKFSIVRSLHHNRNEHSGGTCRLLSGYASVAANPRDAEYPELGSVVSERLDHTATDIPLFIANTKFYGGGSAYLGPAHLAYRYSGDPNGKKFGVSNLTLSDAASKQLRTRTQLLETFDTLRRDVDRSRTMDALDRFNQRAVAMLTGSRARKAFDLSQEDDKLRDRYGRTNWGQSLLLARRLVEHGVRFVQIQATFSLKKETGRTSNWDDHSVNADVFKAYRERMPVFDQCVPALIEDMHARGLNKNTLFIFCGEFGRTPKIRNQDKSGRPGRDHWCNAMSIFLAGGGLKMGQLVGETDARGEHPAQRVMNSNCLLATIYRRFGIDTHHAYHDNSGRPMPILTDGQPIGELL